MNNGGLSRMISGANGPYQMWSGGGVTGTGAMPIPGMPGATKLDPYAPLNSKQLSSLYSTGKYSMPGMSTMSSGIMAGAFPGMMGMQKVEPEDDEVAADDEEDMGVIETYSNYWPAKLTVSLCMFQRPLLLLALSFMSKCKESYNKELYNRSTRFTSLFNKMVVWAVVVV